MHLKTDEVVVGVVEVVSAKAEWSKALPFREKINEKPWVTRPPSSQGSILKCKILGVNLFGLLREAHWEGPGHRELWHE